MMWTVLAVYAAGLGVMSLITLGVYAHDKRRARRGGWRVPERTLHTLELLGGWPGGLLARRWLRHKSVKRSFRLRSAAIVLLHVLGAVLVGFWGRGGWGG